MTSVQIKYPKDWELSSAELKVLRGLFPDHEKLVLHKQFTEGQSDTSVCLAEPHRRGNEVELPVVVKIGPANLIRKEWEASNQHMLGKLPGFIAARKIFPPMADSPGHPSDDELSDAAYAGLYYTLAGEGVFEIDTLRNYTHVAKPADIWHVLDNRLFKQLGRMWQAELGREDRTLRTSYDRVLPVSLALQYVDPNAIRDLAAIDVTLLKPEQIARNGVHGIRFEKGDFVRMEGMMVTETDLSHRTLTLNLPLHCGEQPLTQYRVRLFNVPNLQHLHMGEIVDFIIGSVRETRQDILFDLAKNAIGHDVDLTANMLSISDYPAIKSPNPLHAWPRLLEREISMKIGTIHGDLNMGNVLVDAQARTTQIIDCAHARRDHVLYDLLRLEMEALLHPLAAILFQVGLPPATIHQLYCYVHHATIAERHEHGQFAIPRALDSRLESIYIALVTIRNVARDYLATPGDWNEYYAALTLYLLGSLKFKSLDSARAGQQPRAIAFWGAVTALWLSEGNGNHQRISWQWKEMADDDNDEAHQTQDVKPLKTDICVDNRSAGVYFEGNKTVTIQGDLISGGNVTKTIFCGPVTGPVHTGGGDLYGSSAPPGVRCAPILFPNIYHTFQPSQSIRVEDLESGLLEVDTIRGRAKFTGKNQVIQCAGIREVSIVTLTGEINDWIRMVYTADAQIRDIYFAHLTARDDGSQSNDIERISLTLHRCIRQ